uniref:Platelet-activating factor receptor n=1 Tax=Ailuropoda melanoleuca TaxID=9646 RepID=A0A7N5KJB4_AILME
MLNQLSHPGAPSSHPYHVLAVSPSPRSLPLFHFSSHAHTQTHTHQAHTHGLIMFSSNFLRFWPHVSSFLSCCLCLHLSVFLCVPFSFSHCFPDCPPLSLSYSVFLGPSVLFSLPRSHAESLSWECMLSLSAFSLVSQLPGTLAPAHTPAFPWLCENPLSGGQGLATQLGGSVPPVGGVLGSQHFLPGGDLAVVCSVSSLLQSPDSTEAGSANRHSDPAAAAQPSLTKARAGFYDQLPLSATAMGANDSSRVDSEFRYTLFPIAYGIIFVLGVTANSYVLWVFTCLYPSKKLNEIKIFMVNLTVADLLFLVTLPLWIIYYHNQGNWILPEFLCNLAGCFFFINTYCSVAFLAVITYNRFQAVTRPIKTAQATTRRRGFSVSLVIWVAIVAAASYFFILDSTNVVPSKAGSGNVTRCFEHYEQRSVPVLIIHVFLVFSFFLVFLIIFFCNLVIIRRLLSQPVQLQHNAEVKRRALWMVCTVLAVFIICFVPHHLVQLPWTLAELGFQNLHSHQAINDAHQVTLCLLSTNCVLDPIIYCFLTKKFRKHLTEKFYSMRSSRKCSRATSETGTEVQLCSREWQDLILF